MEQFQKSERELYQDFTLQKVLEIGELNRIRKQIEKKEEAKSRTQSSQRGWYRR